LLLIWGYSFIKGKNLFDNSTKYYVEYSNVEGLTMSSNVTINGLVVGKVSNIDINQQNGKLLVELTMNKSMNISKSSIATIYSPGLISGKGISIDPKFGDTDYASSGDYLKGEVQLDITEKLGGQLEPLQQKVEELLKNANQMLLAINNIIDDKTQVNLKSAIAELDATLTGANQLIATTTPKLDKTMDNLSTVSSNFSELSLELNSLDIKSTFAKLDNATGSLDKICLTLTVEKEQ
jgi:phospholipid/cholesterol/gamma-HCH transport system substrate-binding protein